MLGTCAQGTANMVAGEYWVDTDPGWGQGTATGGLAQPDVANVLFQIPTGTLSVGMHTLGIRTKDAHGHWSLTNVTPLYVAAAPQAANIVRTVYFWNTDAGWNSGTDADIDGTQQVSGQVTASLAGTTPGMNTLFARSQDAHGRWSLTNTTPVYVDVPDANAAIVRTEYFLNSDPGWGAGLDADVDGAAEVPPTATTANIAEATVGTNTLFYRSKDSHGHWSLTNQVPLYVDAADEDAEIVAAESFWDVDPGFGQGDPVPDWTPGADVSGQFNVVVPENLQENGYHQLFVRTFDSHGHWSLTNFGVDTVYVHPLGTGVDGEASASAISTYPNPFTSGITVRTDDGKPLRVVLYDPQGKLVHDKVLNGETYIDLSRHASGTYTAFFWKELERIHRVQLVKQ